MKTQVVALIAFIFCFMAANAKTVVGNGTIITKEVSVSSYDKIHLGGNINCSGRMFGKQKFPCFLYTQGKDTPLRITIDENLYPFLVIESKNNCLSIRLQQNTQIEPTQYKIEGGSRELVEIQTNGPMNFETQNAFKGENLEIRVSGSSDLVFAHPARLRSGDFAVSGSGDISFTDLICGNLDCLVSGSGDIDLKGKGEQADFTVSGSGDIEAFGFAPKQLDCSVSGSGDAEVYATDHMNLSVSGSGEIKYKGPATVQQSKSGSGSIRKSN